MEDVLVQPENKKSADDVDAAISRPAGVDPDWDRKIQRAREAHEAGRRLRKDQPASVTGLLDFP